MMFGRKKLREEKAWLSETVSDLLRKNLLLIQDEHILRQIISAGDDMLAKQGKELEKWKAACRMNERTLEGLFKLIAKHLSEDKTQPVKVKS